MNDGIFYDISNDPDTIRAFQEMLRRISQAEGNLPLVAVDGKYGDGMEAAVRQYQANKGLPVTGRVDADTWNAAAADNERILLGSTPPMGITPFPNLCGFRVVCGEHSNLVMILQIMLDALRLVYDEYGSIPLTGVYDAKTTNAIKCFQKRNFLAAEDCVNKATWDALARQYNMQVNKSQ